VEFEAEVSPLQNLDARRARAQARRRHREDQAEFRAQRRKDIKMADSTTVLDKFLADNDLPVLARAGSVSREEALDDGAVAEHALLRARARPR